MSYFAQINGQNTVIDVIEASQDEIDSGKFGDPAAWIETWIGGGVRKNYAGIGFTYDVGRNAFISPKPYPSWHLVEETCRWDAPIPKPDEIHAWRWDEAGQQWVEFGT